MLSLLWLAAGAPRTARAECQPDDQCRFKKPNVLLLLDYSSSMVGFEDSPAYFPAGQTATKRWDAQLDAVQWLLRYDNGFFADNARVALLRFGHDPDPMTPGTVLKSDHSFPPITDGIALDVPLDGSDGNYLECRNSAIAGEVEVLRSSPPPWITGDPDPYQIMLTWTYGGLASVHGLIGETRARHAAASGEEDRVYEVVLMTDGDWTCPDMLGQNCPDDPAVQAARLRADGIRVHVVAFGDAAMQPSLDEVALQGGTGRAIDATSPQGIVDALTHVLDDIRDKVIVPECTAGLPRVLLIMDGSSSMIEGSAVGETKWDKARFALTGNPAAPNPGDPGYVEPIFAREVDVDGRKVAIEDILHLGLMTFSTADQQLLLSGFGPCMRDNFAWAMDPQTSCQAPGCSDPYAGYPTSWTFRDSAAGDADFVRPTRSYMPACNQTPNSNGCIGQIPNTFTGEGLAFARQVIADYKRNPTPFHADPATTFVNILITDGRTSEGSQGVQASLEGMAAEGIDTYVIGFGGSDAIDAAQLSQYARWGNTGAAITVDPDVGDGAGALADALLAIVTRIDIDACCVLNDCSLAPEPPDPLPVCGDGRIEGDEVCDDGNDNATYGACSAHCDGPHLYCGDGRVDSPEECDSQADPRCDPSSCLREDDEDAGVVADDDVLEPPPPRPRRPTRDASVSPNKNDDDPEDAGDQGPRRPVDKDAAGCGCRLAGTARPLSPLSLLALVPLLRGLRRLRRRA